jgi:hypothetical protein
MPEDLEVEFMARCDDSPEDIARIRRVLGEHGIDVPLVDAWRAWRDYSAETFAGWLGLPPDDDRLWACVEPNARNLDGVPHCSTCSCYQGKKHGEEEGGEKATEAEAEFARRWFGLD